MIGSNIIRKLNQVGESDIIVVDNLLNGYKCKNLLDQEGGVKPYLIKDISGNPKLAGSL